MNTQVGFALRGRNPDVLTCIANLSNDEVFTPPEFANRMLDTVAQAWAANHDGANLWADKTVRFLDPCTKSGVFLREITSRLTEGLKADIPDLRERVNHIVTNQVFGIGITQLTSLLARRSVYCSKHANGAHSVAKGFARDEGNIWFERTEHTWKNGKCVYCGASQETLDRGENLETYAYGFIHAEDMKTWIAEIFGDEMQFDVIIGNPPYQLSDGGFGASAAPIYHLFVEQAKALEPRYLLMIIPARWFAGGKGLDEFRESILSDDRLRSIDDFLSASDVFPGVGLKGGVCYFLWDRNNPGLCQVSTHFKDWPVSTATRPLLEEGADVFIRFNEGLSIDKWKIFMGYAAPGTGNKDTYPHRILSTPFIGEPGSISSETYLCVGSFDSRSEAESALSYLSCRLTRLLVLLHKPSQHITRKVYTFVPTQDWTRKWTDEDLYAKYGISASEIAFIEKVVRPMDLIGASEDDTSET